MFENLKQRFNRNKIRIEVKFHKDANGMAAHGSFWADHKTLGLVNYPVTFAFVGVDTPPKLDRRMFNHILDKAEAAGFIVHGLRTYTGMFQTQGAKVPMNAVREMVQDTPNKRALDAHYAEQRALQAASLVTQTIKSTASQTQATARGLREPVVVEVLDMSGLVGVKA